jgi:hypothetical protein
MYFSYCLYYLGITGADTRKMGQEGAAVICNVINGSACTSLYRVTFAVTLLMSCLPFIVRIPHHSFQGACNHNIVGQLLH